MKHAVNFRLSTDSIHILAILEKKLHTSKTDVIEKALQAYAKKKLTAQNSLLQFSGTLNEQEAAEMLDIIKTSRKNKKKDFSL
jgi:hypothetical protein